MDSIFIRTLCTDRIKIRAGQMTRHFRKSILARLKEKYEGICSHHGYIRKNSIDIYKISPGEVLVHTLNGDIQYTVQYYADICNPTVGTSIRATVLNKNKFGLLAHVYDEPVGGADAADATVRYPILEIIVPRDSMPEDIDFDKIAKGASITISVLGKKFANRDTKISVVGSLTHSHSAPAGTSRDPTNEGVDVNPLEDEEDDIVDLENEEEEEEEDNDGEDADEDAKSTQQNEEDEEDEEEFEEDLEEEEEDMEEEDEDI